MTSDINDSMANTNSILGMTGINDNPFHVGYPLRSCIVKRETSRANSDNLFAMDRKVPSIPRHYQQEQLKELNHVWPLCAKGLGCEGMKLDNVPEKDRFVVRAFFHKREI